LARARSANHQKKNGGSDQKGACNPAIGVLTRFASLTYLFAIAIDTAAASNGLRGGDNLPFPIPITCC
jgi:hypothetical protein